MRALPILVLLALLACHDGPTEVELRGYAIPVPSAWSVEREGNGPAQTVVLVAPERTVLCRVTVVADGRRATATDAHAFVTMGTDAWGTGVGAEPARVDTPDGPLEGVVIAGARMPSAFGVRVLGGEPHIEIVAAPRGDRLLAAIIGHFPSDATSASRARACRDAIASLRSP